MTPRFKSQKAIQLIALVLQRFGGSMDRYPLLKLLWLIEKYSFEHAGRPITYDTFVSMNEGLLPSKTYDLIKNGPGTESWREVFAPPTRYEVALKAEAELPNVLSDFEIETINAALDKYGQKAQREWRDEAHAQPLWKGKHYPNTSIAVLYEEILKEVGLGEYVTEIMSDLESAGDLERL